LRQNLETGLARIVIIEQLRKMGKVKVTRQALFIIGLGNESCVGANHVEFDLSL
jgi:hypothetical protein